MKKTLSGSDEHKVVEEGRTSLGRLLDASARCLVWRSAWAPTTTCFYLLLTWLPSYLSFALHIDLAALVSVHERALDCCDRDGYCGGRLAGGFSRAARLECEHGAQRRFLIGGTACGLGLLGAAHAHTPTRALIWISISIGGLSAASPVGWSLPSLIARRNDVGKVGGIINFSNQISGISAPIITGYLVTAFHSYAWAFGVAAVYLAIGIAAYIFLLGQGRTDARAALKPS